MDHFRLRKYRGPEVWERVREAYVAGEPGPQLARRFDVGLANLRKKAMREGWTRRAAAALNDPLILATQPRLMGAAPETANDDATDPAEARARAIGRAASLLANGRAVEASAILKATEALGRVTAGSEGEPAPTKTEAEEWAERQEQQALMREMMCAQIERRAEWLARKLLEDDFDSRGHYTIFALRWRAEQLGPEVAEHDRRRCEAQGLAHSFYDADGNLRPFGELAQNVRDEAVDMFGIEAHRRAEEEAEAEAEHPPEGPRIRRL